MTSDSWSTSQLVEFLAVLSEQTDEPTALRAAVERVLEALDAEIGVLFGPDGVRTVVGLEVDDPQVSSLIARAQAGADRIHVAGLGDCQTAMVALDIGEDALRLIVVRAGLTGFVPDEMLLLRGMAWVLHLALQPLRVLVRLHERQKVLEQVARVQRSIANREPLTEVFDTVTAGALDLFGSELALLYLADQGLLVLVSVSAVDDVHRPPNVPVRMRSSIGRAAYIQGTLVCTDDYPRSPYADQALVTQGAQAAMAAPVSENGAIVGSLVIVRFRSGHAFTEVQEQTLLMFADQVSTALSDAKTLAAAQHAYRDPVTSLPNRVLFVDRLTQALTRGVPVQVIFLDLDRFKIVNDTLGHAAGDDLLRQVGRRLRECLRSEDCLARFGGDEFAVLVEERSTPEVYEVAKLMLEATHTPYVVSGQEVTVGASIGIAASTDDSRADHLLRDADTAMYRAKGAGGGQAVVFEPAMHTVLVRQASLERDLRQAVARDELFVAFQPIVALDSGRMYSAEALVRWRHRTRGIVGPAEFITLAEETGLIVPIGRRVLATACDYAAKWPVGSGDEAPPSVSVNLSTRQFLDSHLVADITQVLDTSGLDPARLILEITESVLMSDEVAVMKRLHQIRSIGVRLAIDDFGTGYSALSYLRRFPVDILKIDRSFVEGVVVGWQGQAFLQTIMRLTQTLSLIAIGEGIETRDQLLALRAVGCQLGQGHLLAEPMTPEELGEYISRSRPIPATAG
jgi:diguanylate cyclase (GGDEF)-like protein